MGAAAVRTPVGKIVLSAWAGLVLLVLLTAAVGFGWSPLVELDHDVAAHAYRATYGHGARTHFWLFVSAWGAPFVVRGLMLLAALGLAVSRRWSVSIWVVALTVLEAVVAPASKLLLDRPRPAWAHPITVVGSTAYPSGHATAAFTAATVAAILAVRVGSGVAPRAVAGSAVVLAVLVAASRVMLGVHFLSDVCGGALLGVGLALGTWSLLLRVVCLVQPSSRTDTT